MGILSFFRRRKAAAPPGAAVATTEPQAETPARIPVVAGEPGQRILVRPIVTEKSTLLQGVGQVTFRVHGSASKLDVRRAVQRQFGVHVTAVRMVNVHPKVRRRGRILGSVSGYRKAVVSVREGETIDLTKELR